MKAAGAAGMGFESCFIFSQNQLNRLKIEPLMEKNYNKVFQKLDLCKTL